MVALDRRTKYQVPFKDDVLRAFAETAYDASRQSLTLKQNGDLQSDSWPKMGQIILGYAQSLPASASQVDHAIAGDIVSHFDPSLPNTNRGLNGSWKIGVTFAQAQVLLQKSIKQGYLRKHAGQQAAASYPQLSADPKPTPATGHPVTAELPHAGSQAPQHQVQSANASFTSRDHSHIALTEDEQEQEELAPICAQKTEEQAQYELMHRIPRQPETIEIRGRAFKRDNYAIELIKRVRGRQCQFCGMSVPTRSGRPYVEAAHIQPHGNGGPAVPSNILILCPNHHKEFDFGDPTWDRSDDGKTIFKLNGETYPVHLNPES
jgi:hypothetical protein